MKKAFTFIELLVSVAIVAVLVGGAAASYSLLNRNARNNRRKADIENIRAALEMYRSNEGLYPFTNHLGDLSPTYISPLPTDPKTGLTYSDYTSADGSTYLLRADMEPSGHYQAGPYGASVVP